MKISAVLAAIVLVSAVSACSSGSTASDNGSTAPDCYSTVTSPQGSSVTVAALGTSDCASVAQFLGDQFPGYTVTPAGSAGPGNAVCQGMLGGSYPATVIDPTGNAEDVECTELGFSPAP